MEAAHIWQGWLLKYSNISLPPGNTHSIYFQNSTESLISVYGNIAVRNYNLKELKMAILKEINTAALKGKLGDFIARSYNGQIILSKRPAKYKINQGLKAKEGRNKFGVTAHLSKSIASLPTLKAIWKTVKGTNRTVFHTICKYNFDKSSASNPTLNNIITPNGFLLPDIDAAVDAGKITASFSALNTLHTIKPTEIDLSVNAVICFIDSINKEEKPYCIIECAKEIEKFKFERDCEVVIEFDRKQRLIAAKYNGCILYLCAATKDDAGNVVRYSRTFSKEIVITQFTQPLE